MIGSAHLPFRAATSSFVLFLTTLLLFSAATGVRAQNTEFDNNVSNSGATVVGVIVDGKQLFLVRGVSSYPAKIRAESIRKRIIDVARNHSIAVTDLSIVENEDHSSILAGETLLVGVYDVDAEIEGIKRQILATVIKVTIASAITQYRKDRSSPVLLQNSVFALGATAVMVLLLWGVLRLFRWLDFWAVRHVQKNLESLANKSHQLIHGGQIWTLGAGLLRALRVLSIMLLIYFYLNSVLSLYPWTRPAALILFDLIFDPLKSLGQGFLSTIPNLMFLFILFLVIRYILRITGAFFRGVSSGKIKLQNFDSDWAIPTFKILRFLIIAFSFVIAYPYIPGSDTDAFKGVSLFIGVIFSLGSSSFIANMLAGLTMTYRGAFKENDRVKIDDVVGKVEEIKLMITRVRTAKNEIVVIPNSNILNTNVVNYSALAKAEGLVLHTNVGIGYEVPWRQVEAMLLLAAARTEGLNAEPKPYVLQRSLDDFAVNYELNAYCNDASRMLALYSSLHSHIQDVFNEQGVQIMTPNYEGDPATPKVVPPDQWFAAPAVKPET